MSAGHHRVAVLHGRDGADLVGAAQILLRRLRDSPVENLPLADQVGHRARLLLGLHLRVDAVLVVEIDAVGAQAAERLLHRTADGRRTRVGNEGVRPCAVGVVERQPEFRGEDDPVAEGAQRLAQQLLVVVRPVGRAVDLRRIEEVIAHLHGIGQQLRHLALVGRSAVSVAHAHTAQPHGGDPQPAQSQYSVLHRPQNWLFDRLISISETCSLR